MKRWMPIALLAAMAACPCAAATIDVAPYAKNDDFDTIKLSPNGDYYAASVPMEGKSVLLIVHRSDNKPTGGFSLGKNTYVGTFDWVSPKRLVFSMERKFGALDQPQLTGDLYGIDADGGAAMLLVGSSVQQMSTGTHIQGRTTERVAAELVDDLRGDDQQVLVAVTPFTTTVRNEGRIDPATLARVERMDVDTGKRMPVTRSPVGSATFWADHHGVVRFVAGVDANNVAKVYYRTTGDEAWSEINNSQASGHDEWPLGFSADDRTAYLSVSQATGPDAIVAMDGQTRVRKEILRDADGDPVTIVYAQDVPIGAVIASGKPHTVFFDPASADARLQRSLEAAFPGDTVSIASRTDDGKLALVEVSSARNPGDFYVSTPSPRRPITW